MKKYPIKIQVYEEEIQIPILIFFGTYIEEYARILESLGCDSTRILTVSDEEEIDIYAGEWIIFFCSKWRPSLDYIDQNKNWIFIDCNYTPHIHSLADITGLNAIRGLIYDAENRLWINQGKASAIKEHKTSELAVRFSKEIAKWIAAGGKLRSQEIIESLFDTFCARCSDYIGMTNENRSKCNLCGCNINLSRSMFNKLALNTTTCPANPPKWTSDISISDESIQNRSSELYQQYIEIQKKDYPDQTGSICDCAD